jgi:hypothetical protein
MDENNGIIKSIINDIVEEIILDNKSENIIDDVEELNLDNKPENEYKIDNVLQNDIIYDSIYNSNTTDLLINNPLIIGDNNDNYNFVNDSSKLLLLQDANNKLNITKSNLNKIIFVYTCPKVGSTSLVTSIRLFASHIYNIIHIHDEEMLKKLSNITNISINEIIFYNKYIGKEVYVIDVYRCPIERKISTFFEKIDTFHFNNNCENINKYNIKKIINRFNKIYPYIGNGDNFIDSYNINIPSSFDIQNKYLNIQENGISYIKLRLKDSQFWGDILSNIFKINIKIVKDYETNKKLINSAYLSFKENYKIPINYLEELDSCRYLNYYYSEKEKEEYFSEWSNKVDIICKPFNPEEYRLYEYISFENKYMDDLQSKHYLDEGCHCKACFVKRVNIASKLINGQEVNEYVIHENAKQEFISNRINNFKKVKNLVKNKDNKKSLIEMKLI